MDNKDFSKMSLDELEKEATELRNIRTATTETLRLVVSEIDKRKATESVRDIVSGLSDEQRKEMYSQLVGVNQAVSVGKSETQKGVKANG